MNSGTSFAGLIQAFFTDRLLQQRRASPHTVAGYRDTFRLFLRFAARRLGKEPSRLSLGELDAPFVGDFLDHLEKERGVTARSRNTRLAAIHSFFRYVSFREPVYADQCRRVLAIPSKRYERKLIEHLTPEEIDALLAAPDRATWVGRRDRALLMVAVQTGLRVSELIGLRRERRRPRDRRPPPLRGQGSEGALHAAPAGSGRRPDPMAPRVPCRAGDPGVPQQPRRAAESGRCGAAGRPSPAGCGRAMPVAAAQAGDTARAAPHHGHATAPTRRRSLGHRAVAGARVGGDNPDVPACGLASQGRSLGEGNAVGRAAGPVPAG